MILSDNKRCIELGKYIYENKATVRKTAEVFGISKSTVHKDVTKTLISYDTDLYYKVREVMELNKSLRHIRGGLATKKLYEDIRRRKNNLKWKINDMKNKELKNPDNYTVGKRKKFPLANFLFSNFAKVIAFILVMIAIVIIFVKTANFFAMPFIISAIILLFQGLKIKRFLNNKKIDKFISADKTSLYSFRKKYSIAEKIDFNQDYFIAETNIHRIAQIIRGKDCFYIHYLKISKNGRDFEKSSLITDFSNIDNCKKYTSKDFRIKKKDIKNIIFSAKSVSNTILENFGTININLNQKSGHRTKNLYFYPVYDYNSCYINDFFSEIKDISEKKIIIEKESFKDIENVFGKRRFVYLGIKNLMYISTVFCIFAFNYFCYSVSAIIYIISVISILIFYLIYNNEYSIADYKKGEENGDFSATPNIFLPVMMSECFNFLCVLQINMLSFSKYSLVSLTFSAVIIILILILSSEEKRKIILPLIIISVFLSASSVGYINQIFDFSEPQIYNSKIYDKSISSGSKGSLTYYIETEVDKKHMDLRVSYDEYMDCKTGDTVEIYKYNGLLRIEYAEIYFDENNWNMLCFKSWIWIIF